MQRLGSEAGLCCGQPVPCALIPTPRSTLPHGPQPAPSPPVPPMPPSLQSCPSPGLTRPCARGMRVPPVPPAAVGPTALPTPGCPPSEAPGPPQCPGRAGLTLWGKGSQGVRGGEAQHQSHQYQHLGGEGQRWGKAAPCQGRQAAVPTRGAGPGCGRQRGRGHSSLSQGGSRFGQEGGERSRGGSGWESPARGGRWAQHPALPSAAPGRRSPLPPGAPQRSPDPEGRPLCLPCRPWRALLLLALHGLGPVSCGVYTEPGPCGAAPR